MEHPIPIPAAVKAFFDRLHEHGRIRTIAEFHGLQLRQYEHHHPEAGSWLHNLVGNISGQEVTVQIYVTEQMAAAWQANVRGFVFDLAEKVRTGDGWVLRFTWHSKARNCARNVEAAIKELKKRIKASSAS